MTFLPDLGTPSFGATRDAIHAYSRVLGDYLKACRPKRKHWWHASLRPSLNGLTTGIVRAQTDFDIELNLRESRIAVNTSSGEGLAIALHGQPAAQVRIDIGEFLAQCGVESAVGPSEGAAESAFDNYSPADAQALGLALRVVATAMESYRATIREETSPVQVWPHHFDLSMIWLPGDRIPGQDPADEEHADVQMNFGFTFGDGAVPEPYFYITAYPLPDALPGIALPTGANWQSEGFSGAVLPYRELAQHPDPQAGLTALWNCLLAAGREHMTASSDGERTP